MTSASNLDEKLDIVKEAEYEPSDSEISCSLDEDDNSMIETESNFTNNQTDVQSFRGGGLIRENTLRLSYINKAKSKILINKKSIREPEKTGDGLSDFVSQYSYSLGMDPSIFTLGQSKSLVNVV